METTLIASMLIFLFLHWMGLTPLGSGEYATPASTFFVAITMMALQKMMIKNSIETKSWRSQIVQGVVFCVISELMLCVLWQFLAKGVQGIGDAILDCIGRHVSDGGRNGIEKIRPYFTPAVLLVVDAAILLRWFLISDMQQYFGVKDDLITDSALAILLKWQINNLRYENRRRRMNYY